jgi:signal transduction histidine kinase
MPPPSSQRQPIGQLAAPVESALPQLQRALDLLVPAIPLRSDERRGTHPRLQQAREQILTGLLRSGALLGTLALIIAVVPPLLDTPTPVLIIDALLLALTWALAFLRTIDYRLRAGVLLVNMYLVSVNELLYYGFSQDGSILLAFFALLGLLLFDLKVGAGVLAIGLGTLACAGAALTSGAFTPLAHPLAELSVSTMITTCLIYLMVVGSIQVGMALLLDHLVVAWQQEQLARTILSSERDLLEQRVAERTHALALSRDQALAAQSRSAQQRELLARLHETTIDLLRRRELDDLIQTIVERSTAILDAPYGELMLVEGDELVVRAFSANQPFLRGDRVRRSEAKLSWQAFDSQQPAVLADYATWTNQRSLYDQVGLHAVADFPIMVGGTSVGVLALGRDAPGRVFTADEIWHGQLFAQLAALVVENARLYDTALSEIHERAKAEQLLLQQAHDLQTQNAELDAFARTVAHDLKSPLSTIVGHSQMLLEVRSALTPGEIGESLQSISRMGQKMATIIDELLLLALVRSRESVPREIVPIARVAAEAGARLHGLAAAARASIHFPENMPDALGYAPWIEEVWVNYISNAIKYGGEPPTITLGADPPRDGFVRYWVADNGPGLSPEQQATLFTPFTRLHAGRAEGHGLGLTIVQRIVEKLGGEAGVESAPGQGARFFFTLPAA